MKKNNDKKNEPQMKVAETIEKKLEQMPVLTKAELEELKAKAVGFGDEVADKGCWIGLGMFRPEDGKPKMLIQAEGDLTMLALMVSEAMKSNAELEMVFLLAVGMRMKSGEDNNEDNEENNEDNDE